jgi:very-short-patch-repair endonuclease
MFNKIRTKNVFGYDLDLTKRRRSIEEFKLSGGVYKKHLVVVDNCPVCGIERNIKLSQSLKNKPCSKCFHNSSKMKKIKKNLRPVFTEEHKQKMKDNHWSKKGGIPWQKGRPFSEEAKKKMIITNLKRGHIKGISVGGKKIPISLLAKNEKIGYEKLKLWISKNKTDITEEKINGFIKSAKECSTYIEAIIKEKLQIDRFDRKIEGINTLYKPDFKMSANVYLNVDGLYWHSENIKSDNFYHFNLRKKLEEKGIRIFQFREDEINDKIDIVISIIKNSIGKTKNKEYAREMEIRDVKSRDAEIFLQSNHLMGKTKARHIGLFKENILYSILSFKKNKDNIIKIERFCSLLDTNVLGGYSRLLSYIERTETPSKIHNWVDLRYGVGNHLLNMGFKKIKDTLGWKWTNWNKTFNRRICRANMDERRLSEKEHATEMKLVRIYDAGQRLYVKYL